MDNWTLLRKEETEKFWSFAYEKLHFMPTNVLNTDLIALPKPNVSFDIADFYDKGFDEKLYEDLHESALVWFEEIANGKRLYAFNWQHECYSFLPGLPFEKDEFAEWFIPVFPNGDYLFFVMHDFSNGIFADGINCKISFWGEAIINTLNSNMPSMLLKSKKYT